MHSEAETPEEYLAALDHDWRRVALLTLRETIAKVAPGLGESMGYGMLRYSDSDGPVLHLNAQRAYVALYLGDIAALDPDGSLTAGFSRGKGCLRFSKSKDVGDARVAMLLERLMARRDSGETTAC